jgi:hypothetical protein
MESIENPKRAIFQMRSSFHTRLRWYLLLGAVLVFGIAGTAHANCWKDVVERRNGDLLATRSGGVYRVLDNPARTTFWLPLTRLTICEQVVVNAIRELTAIYEIRNQDDNEMVNAARQR